MIRLILIAMLVLSGRLHAEFVDKFPGFKELHQRSSFVGIVKVERADGEDYYSSWKRVTLHSEAVFKGQAIENEMARLSDRHITMAGDKVISWPDGYLIQPDARLLVFLYPEPVVWSKGLYKWAGSRAEGTILPISPLTRIDELDVKKPMEAYAKIVADYSKYCDQMAACARRQKEFIEQMTKDGK